MGVTVIEAEPVTPSLVAVIDTVPPDTAVTSPFASTDATAGLELDQATARPVSALLVASLRAATAWVLCPTVRLGELSVTVMLATGTFATVIVALPLTPSLVALIDAAPAATPVT